jgi:hypothetical protein
MMAWLRMAGGLALVAALAGCGEKKAAKSDDQRQASGQILPGTISDAMIAYDALTSQPPVAAVKREASAAQGAESAVEAAPAEAAADNAPEPD